MKHNLNKYLIAKNKKVKDALILIDKNGERTCFVIDEKKRLLGSLTDGDIRRNIYKRKKNINEKVYKFCNKKTKYLIHDNFDKKKVKQIFIRRRIDIIPVVDDKKRIVEVILKSENFGIKQKKKTDKTSALSNTKVVIMAGGKGQRLDPITKIFPKPLVPLKDKTAIENILDSFLKFGVKKFYFILNFKSDLIKAYFSNKPAIKQKIKYLSENKPLGTAGGLEKLKRKISGNFIVSNCDVIFDFNFKELMRYHLRKKNDLTLVTSNQTSILPYGVCTINSKKELLNIQEKPKYKHLITTGLYVFNSKILDLIPRNKFLDMNNFITILKKRKKKIGTFKINKSKWYDIGQLREYKKRLDSLNV